MRSLKSTANKTKYKIRERIIFDYEITFNIYISIYSNTSKSFQFNSMSSAFTSFVSILEGDSKLESESELESCSKQFTFWLLLITRNIQPAFSYSCSIVSLN